MPQKSRNRKLSRTALCAVSGIALVIAGGAPVRAGDGSDDGSSEGPYKKFFNKMMTDIGLRDQDAAIEYKERPPLVVPPTRDLPPPSTASSPAARNAAWPTDADAKRRKGNNARTPERSVLAGEKASDQALPPARGDGTQQQSSGGMWSSLTGWTKTLTGNNNESSTFVREPTRNALTDPPVGYRTPSPTQPYGINGLADKAKSKSAEDRQADTVNGPPAPK